MAGNKKHVPRQSRSVEPRHDKTVQPRWQVLENTAEKTVLNAEHFRNRDGSWKTDEIYRANQKYGNKPYGMELEGEAVVFRPAHIHKNAEGGLRKESAEKIRQWSSVKGKAAHFYEVPLRDPTEPGLVAKAVRDEKRLRSIKRLVTAKKTAPKTVREYVPHAELPHVRYRNTYLETTSGRKLTESKLVSTPPSDPDRRKYYKGNDRVFRTEGEARLYNDQRRVREMQRRANDLKTDPVERAALKRQLRDIVDENARLRSKPAAKPAPKSKLPVVPKAARAPKTVVPKATSKQPLLKTPRGAKYDGSTQLSPSQYLGGNQRVWTRSATRRQEMERTAAKRQKAELKRQAQREYRIAIRNAKHQAAMRRRRIKERAREPGRRLMKQMIRQAGVVRMIRGLQQFHGRQPLPMTLKNANWASRKAINKAMRSLPHSERYPAVGHAGPSPMRPPVSMAAVSGKMTLTEPRDGNRSRVAGTKVYATTKTVEGRGGSGTGVMFRINADAVIANLTQRYPQALAAAAKSASASVGRKLLDIVEPYVPKDTGLMYTTAQIASDQTADGLVDIDGAEAYPSSQMFGVSISYNTPYAEDVYFDPTKAHGEAYNRKHNTSEKGEKEQFRWIEAAFREESGAIQGLLGEYAQLVTAAFESMPSLQGGGHMSPRRR